MQCAPLTVARPLLLCSSLLQLFSPTSSLVPVAKMLSVSLCFSMEMSAFFAAVGLFSSYWIWSRTNNGQLASGVFFFFTMELLQVVQVCHTSNRHGDERRDGDAGVDFDAAAVERNDSAVRAAP